MSEDFYFEILRADFGIVVVVVDSDDWDQRAAGAHVSKLNNRYNAFLSTNMRHTWLRVCTNH